MSRVICPRCGGRGIELLTSIACDDCDADDEPTPALYQFKFMVWPSIPMIPPPAPLVPPATPTGTSHDPNQCNHTGDAYDHGGWQWCRPCGAKLGPSDPVDDPDTI